MKRETVIKIFEFLVPIVADIDLSGVENVPSEGAYVVVINHTSRLDTPFLAAATARKDVIALVANDYKKVFLLGWILDALDVIWVSREEYDFTAFRAAVDYLKQGWMVGLAPEGRRSRTGSLMPGKPGAALMAGKAGVQVVPTTIIGANTMGESFSHLRKMKVAIHYGKPFSLPPKEVANDKEWLQTATDEIMCQIAALLPPELRGVYADFPRLKELLELQAAY